MELAGARGDTLRAAGICSGDTLWLMTPSDQKDSDASSTGNVEPVMTSSLSAAASLLLGASHNHEIIAVPPETIAAPLPTVRDFEDDALQYPAQVSCCNNAAILTQLCSKIAGITMCLTSLRRVCRMNPCQKPNPASQTCCSECLTAVLKPHITHTSSCC